MKITRLKKGDLVVDSLEKEFRDQKSGLIIGLGALRWARLKVYNLETKTYKAEQFEGPLEVASFSAVVCKNPDGKIGLHSHTVLSREDFTTVGGHLEEAEVSATFEYVFLENSDEIKRYHDTEIGLNLIKN